MRITVLLGWKHVLTLPSRDYSEGLGRPRRVVERNPFGQIVRDEIQPPHAYLVNIAERP